MSCAVNFITRSECALCNTSVGASKRVGDRRQDSDISFDQLLIVDFLGDRYTSITTCSVHLFLQISCETHNDTRAFTTLTCSIGTELISQNKAHHGLISMRLAGKKLRCVVSSHFHSPRTKFIR